MTFAELHPPYATIVADPPWPIKWDGGKGGRRRRATPLAYSLMTIDEITALPVRELASDAAHLYLWITPALNRIGVGIEVARAWGFDIVGEIVWMKPNLGMGAFPRTSHEILLVCRRGRLPFARRDVHSVQRWREVRAPNNGGKVHSAKPPASYDLIESCSPPRYVDLFARQTRFGWDSWGRGFEGASA